MGFFHWLTACALVPGTAWSWLRLPLSLTKSSRFNTRYQVQEDVPLQTQQQQQELLQVKREWMWDDLVLESDWAVEALIFFSNVSAKLVLVVITKRNNHGIVVVMMLV